MAAKGAEQAGNAVHQVAIDGLPIEDAGAVGYVTKKCPPDEFYEAILQVSAGNHYLSKDVATTLALGKMYGRGSESPLNKLAPREMQVMVRIAHGEGTQQIADSLCISPKTVSTYRTRLFEKLDVSNDVELTLFAIRHQLIDPP